MRLGTHGAHFSLVVSSFNHYLSALRCGMSVLLCPGFCQLIMERIQSLSVAIIHTIWQYKLDEFEGRLQTGMLF